MLEIDIQRSSNEISIVLIVCQRGTFVQELLSECLNLLRVVIEWHHGVPPTLANVFFKQLEDASLEESAFKVK